MGDKLRERLSKLKSYPYVLLVAAAGILLLLWPASGASAAGEGGESEETRIAEMLSSIEGVGEAKVLLSENGAVIVCPGADDASVCLRITQAVKCYTGLGADDVRIFRTTNTMGG